jgi:hypothetical protein
MEGQRINVSRQLIETITEQNVESLGASYTHIKSLKGIIGKNTKKIVMYHSFLESLEGFEDTDGVQIAYLGFNRIKKFREIDKDIKLIEVLDLVGNPITSLQNCPPCRQLIISSTLINDLVGCPDGVEIIRCGHSTHLKSLKGCPKSVKIIECSCAPNLIIYQRDLPNELEQLLGDQLNIID